MGGVIRRAKTELLECRVSMAALALAQYTEIGGFIIPVLKTQPQLYVAYGTKAALLKALKDLKEEVL